MSKEIRIVDFEKEKKAYEAQFCCEKFRILYERYDTPLEFNEDENVWKIKLTLWFAGHYSPEEKNLIYCFSCGKKPKLKEPIPHHYIHEEIK